MATVKKFWAACKGGVAACTTAWDYPTARLCEEAGIDLILVGDSLAITSLGMSSTVSTTLEQIIYHSKAVRRGAPSPFLLADLPLGTYERNPEQAVDSALRLIKEGNADGVKLEGGKEMAPQVEAITKAGVPVIGHIGLTPQRALATLNEEIESMASSGGATQSFGSTAHSAQQVLQDALALQAAGAVGLCLEAVAAPAAQMITDALKIPTLGIGCGPTCSSQLTVQSEVLGYLDTILQKWHVPYASIGATSVAAMREFKDAVREKRFPTSEHAYVMAPGEDEKMRGICEKASKL